MTRLRAIDGMLDPEDRIVQLLGRNLAFVRSQRGWKTHNEAADRSGVDARTWIAIESAERLKRNWRGVDDARADPVDPSLDTICRLASALQVSPRQLFAEDPKSGAVPATAGGPIGAQVGRAVRDRRQKIGLTIEKAAEAADIPARTWQRLEVGATKPLLSRLLDIAAAVDAELIDLLPVTPALRRG